MKRKIDFVNFIVLQYICEKNQCFSQNLGQSYNSRVFIDTSEVYRGSIDTMMLTNILPKS